MPPPTPVPRTPNPAAYVGLGLGIAATTLAFVLGVFLLGLDAIFAFVAPAVLGAGALAAGIVGLVRVNRHGGRGILPASLALLLGLTPFAALFVGRVTASEFWGM